VDLWWDVAIASQPFCTHHRESLLSNILKSKLQRLAKGTENFNAQELTKAAISMPKQEKTPKSRLPVTPLESAFGLPLTSLEVQRQSCKHWPQCFFMPGHAWPIYTFSSLGINGVPQSTLPLMYITPSARSPCAMAKLGRVRIQKPVVTYNVVTCDKKAVCPDLFAALPNVFHHINFTIFIKHCRCNLWSGNATFEILTYWKIVLKTYKNHIINLF
jgi:hypothetical protein